MTTSKLILIGLITLIVSACSSNQGQIDYQAGVDLSGFNAFEVVAKDADADPLTSQRLTSAISNHMQQRGWQQLPANSNGAKLFYSTKQGVKAKDSAFSIGLGGGSFGSSGGISGGVSVPVGEREMTVLLLQLDVVDNGQLLWRGSDELELDGSDSPQQRQADLQQAVDKLLAQFPPGGYKRETADR